MSNPFFGHPILNSPYACPVRHWELAAQGQPTQRIIESRRRAEFITPIPKPRKRKTPTAQAEIVFDEGKGLSTKEQQYDPTSMINELRQQVDQWRALPSPSQWQVTPETARLLEHWRRHKFGGVRPFFCQVEAAETAIWLMEVAPQSKSGKRVLEHLASANQDANPELMRLALKLATGAGKTTVMAMIIAWQTINAVRRLSGKKFTRGFLVVAPGLTIKDRLRVLQPNDPDSYYASRELVPSDMLDDVNRAKIVITNALQTRLKRLVGGEPRLAERIDVHSLNALGRRLYKSHFGPVALASGEAMRDLLAEAAKAVGGHKFSLHFLVTEWEHVVDAWQLGTWEAYREVARLGRKTRLPEAQRAVLWSIFGRVREGLREKKLSTYAGLFTALASAVAKTKHPPFDFAVVDEAQDLSVSQLRFLAALGGERPNALFFAGDLGQRIFQQPFSWKSLGVDIRGRSRNLRINYRTSHQIRMQADRLLGPEMTDVDGNAENRRDTVSVFNGPPPVIRVLATENEEIKTVATWLTEQGKAGVLPHEFGVFVRSARELARAQAAVKEAGLPFKVLDEQVETTSGQVSVSTMHLAKGLEFRAVAVMACDDEVVPLQERIKTVGDDADLQEVYDTERHLLYVACTRVRDRLLVTGVRPGSEFLDDLQDKTRAVLADFRLTGLKPRMDTNKHQ
jgi:UvrD-like helicase C-terminal domain/Type III restriction enzyme, res subunit/UvrD/REP helicase N-terminal domain